MYFFSINNPFLIFYPTGVGFQHIHVHYLSGKLLNWIVSGKVTEVYEYHF